MALNLGTISLIPTTSSNAAALSKDALALISEIKRLEQKFNGIAADAVQFSIERRKEGEGDIELLGRIAKEASMKAHTLAAEEDLKRVDNIIAGDARPTRRGLAGLLDRAADKVARF